MQHNFQKLKIWQVVMEMVDEVYILTKKFRKEELFGLTVQARKAAVAMPSSISEGAGRKTKKDFSNFIGISLGSGNALMTQLFVAQKQDYDTLQATDVVISRINEWQNMTVSFQENNLKD
ncbi:MAG TPA: four helix bundle protein [Chitinophagales bacterium]|nr:four helix bundle protein [Chitinophagales bacterium]